ncbi:MAG: sigma-E factor negative regulatory protein RseA [Polaribacter sp.]|jgi:sigma-E factor negative regulatory protein RseA
MNQKIDSAKLVSEQLVSDLLDEQITTKALDELLSKEDVNESFYRYNAVSKVLRDELVAPVNMDFVSSLIKKLDNEPTILVPLTNTSPNQIPNNHRQDTPNNVIPLFSKIKKLTGGMAIAASVAVATLISVQSFQVVNDEGVFNSDIAILPEESKVNNVSIEPANNWLETAEQKELEVFNDMFMSKARQSEQEAIAPFARAVRGQSLGTIRFSKEHWEYLLRRSAHLNEEQKVKEETQE